MINLPVCSAAGGHCGITQGKQTAQRALSQCRCIERYAVAILADQQQLRCIPQPDVFQQGLQREACKDTIRPEMRIFRHPQFREPDGIDQFLYRVFPLYLTILYA